MFGLDQLFDFNRNGKLEAFERASEMAFLYSAEQASKKQTEGMAIRRASNYMA